MAKSLEQILGWESLLGIVEDVRSGVPRVLPEAFYRTAGPPVNGDRGVYTRVEGTRQTARAVLYGAPSAAREGAGISTQSVTLANLYEHIFIAEETMRNLRSFDSPERQVRGQEEIARQIGIFFQRFGNARTSMLMSALAKGAIYFDASYNLLPSSTNAVITVDFGISANHKDQLNGIIGTTWATDSTDIAGDIIALKKQAMEDYGDPLRIAIYGSSIPEYLGSNTTISKFIAGSPSFSEQMVNGAEIPNGLMGLTWVPGYTSMYQDNDGTYQYWVGADTVIFTPAPSAEWLQWLEGTYDVPTTIDVAANVNAALSSAREVRGFNSWCTLETDPFTVKQLGRDLVLPVIAAPAALWIADVTP